MKRRSDEISELSCSAAMFCQAGSAIVNTSGYCNLCGQDYSRACMRWAWLTLELRGPRLRFGMLRLLSISVTKDVISKRGIRGMCNDLGPMTALCFDFPS